MTREIQIFENSKFGFVRTVEIGGKPYFVANDIARALGYKRPADAITAHCKGSVNRRYLTDGGEQEMKIIPEGDVYRLIVRSQLPSAEQFESWVFDEVLPSIRRNGGYIVGQESLTDDELLERAVIVAQKKIAERDEMIANKDARIREMRPKEVFADAVAASNTSLLVRDVAKLIRQNGIPLGEKRFYKWLRENGFICKNSTAPTQKAMEQGLFEIVIRTVERGNGLPLETKTTKVTGKGQIYFIQRFLHQESEG